MQVQFLGWKDPLEEEMASHCSFSSGLPQWLSGQRICLPMQETQETQIQSLGQEDPWRRKWHPTPASPAGFPSGSAGKEFVCQCRRHKRHRFSPWVRKIPRGGNGNPLQSSCLENPMDRGAWQATVHGVAKSWTWLSD